jgi:hypothetical protein
MASDQVLYDPERHGTLLTPEAAIRRLRDEHAIKMGEQRLADLRSMGGGPQFIKPTQRDVRYPANLLDEWATQRNRKPIIDFVPLKPAARQESNSRASLKPTPK